MGLFLVLGETGVIMTDTRISLDTIDAFRKQQISTNSYSNQSFLPHTLIPSLHIVHYSCLKDFSPLHSFVPSRYRFK